MTSFRPTIPLAKDSGLTHDCRTAWFRPGSLLTTGPRLVPGALMREDLVWPRLPSPSPHHLCKDLLACFPGGPGGGHCHRAYFVSSGPWLDPLTSPSQDPVVATSLPAGNLSTLPWVGQSGELGSSGRIWFCPLSSCHTGFGPDFLVGAVGGQGVFLPSVHHARWAPCGEECQGAPEAVKDRNKT